MENLYFSFFFIWAEVSLASTARLNAPRYRNLNNRAFYKVGEDVQSNCAVIWKEKKMGNEGYYDHYDRVMIIFCGWKILTMRQDLRVGYLVVRWYWIDKCLDISRRRHWTKREMPRICCVPILTTTDNSVKIQSRAHSSHVENAQKRCTGLTTYEEGLWITSMTQ